jgi:hypothetical protein
LALQGARRARRQRELLIFITPASSPVGETYVNAKITKIAALVVTGGLAALSASAASTYARSQLHSE